VPGLVENAHLKGGFLNFFPSFQAGLTFSLDRTTKVLIPPDN
jgi:hypothetical protein